MTYNGRRHSLPYSFARTLNSQTVQTVLKEYDYWIIASQDICHKLMHMVLVCALFL